MPSIMLILVSLPLGVLSSMTKCAACVVISSPLILIGTTPLCLGGILRVDLTVPVVAFLGGHMCKGQKSTIPLYISLLVFIPSVR